MAAKRVVPALNRILVEKTPPPARPLLEILVPNNFSKLKTGKVVAVGPGAIGRDGNHIPALVKEGDTVLLPEFGGAKVNLGDKDYLMYREDDILGTLEF